MGGRKLVWGALVCCGVLGCAPAAAGAPRASEVCGDACDGLDPGQADGDRVPVTRQVGQRTVALHLDDPRSMGWAAIEGARAGDSVWVDRSFDGSRSWDGPLGETSAPGDGSWRSAMFNVDDPANRGVGALRACAKTADSGEIGCTPWARSTRNAADPGQAAATALMMLYDRGTGLFDGGGWWTSANALTALIDEMPAMGSYEYVIGDVYDRNLGAWDGNFTSEALDDTAWWGLAWIAAYDRTGDRRYLDTARADADHLQSGWNDECGGGVTWKTDPGSGKNAITNELHLQLNAALHNRIPGDTEHLDRARAEWEWFRGTGMINQDGLVNDGLHECRNNGATTWTYNQGVLLGGLVELHRATGDEQLLAEARRLADASTGAADLHDDSGILVEPCEPDCDPDGPPFKGAYVRNLGVLNRELADHPYTGYLRRQADSAMRHRTELDMYGLAWNGPLDRISHERQLSAVDLLTAAEG